MQLVYYSSTTTTWQLCIYLTLCSRHAVLFIVASPMHHTHACWQAKPDTDFSELVLYEVQVMMEGDMYESALKHINSFESSICDTGCLFENKGTVVW